MREGSLPLSRYWVQRLMQQRASITTTVRTEEEEAWDKLVLQHLPGSHFMQSSAWGVSKARSQWPLSRFIAYSDNDIIPMQVFSRTIPGLGRLYYAPGVSHIQSNQIRHITSQIRQQYKRGMVFKLELYQPQDEQLISAFLENGWQRAHSVQHRNTVIVNLGDSEERLLMSYKKRARYEVRIAQRNGVVVEKCTPTPDKMSLLATLMDITAKRSGAFFRKNTYTNRYWDAFGQAGQGALYFVRHEADVLAGAYVITYGDRAWYKDGGSVRHKVQLMGPRLLQWEIMRDLQRQGIKSYDLSGIPAESERETSSMQGLYVFKTGFSKETTTLMPALELPLGKRYSVWPKTEPQFLRFYSGFRRDFWY